MAGEPGEDELLLDTVIEGEVLEIEQEGAAKPDDAASDDDADETVILFGDDAAPGSEESDTGLVRKLRQEIRERDKRLAQIEQANRPQEIEVGPRPTLEACEYDEDRHAEEVEAWLARKAEADQAKTKAATAAQQAQAAWQSELAEYGRKKASLVIPGKDEAEETATAALSQVQQAIIVKGADNPALVVVALGKHPQKLAALSSITDPVKFAFAVSKLERELKVTTRRKAPEPEGTVRGSASNAGSSDKILEKLEREAAASGDRSAVIRYKREQRATKH